MNKSPCYRVAYRARRFGSLGSQKGQSLVEFAMSISFLLLVFSGAIDLGRAYFSWIQVQSAVSEGAHWAAAYPACIPNYTDSQSGGAGPYLPRCQGSNSIFERILNEDKLLNRNDYLCIKAL